MSTVQTSFGRVDETGNVYLIENGTERVIGSQPTMSADQALAFYVKRFEDAAASVRLLEQRIKAKADPKAVSKSAQKLLAELESPAMIGDVSSLRIKLTSIVDSLSETVAQLDLQRKEELEKLVSDLEKIVVTAEEISATDTKKINFKQASAKLAELFESWQAIQKANPKLPKSKTDPLWKRFSQARNTFESAKRSYFASQDQLVKANKNAKSDLVAKAEALVAKGAEGSLEYKNLRNAWKALPKIKSKHDDELWAKFKAAGDAIYAARAEKIAADDTEFAANLEVKLALLVEAEALNPENNLEATKEAMKSIRARWDKAGKVPRDSIKKVEERLRAVEAKIKAVEDELWRKSDPATIDRTNSVKSQLESAISKLERDLEQANSKGDSKLASRIQEEIETKKTWLKVVQG